MASGEEDRGHVIFITGVISSGKTTLTDALKARTTTFYVLTGDDELREIASHRPTDTPHDWFLRLLHRVRMAAQSSNVILDMTLPKGYVTEAREAFGPAGLFVGLRLSEEVRVARESSRTDRSPKREWTADISGLRGGDELYDINLDSGEISPDEMAEAVVAKATEHWPGLAV